MLDINLLRHDPRMVEEALAKRGLQVNLDDFLQKDEERRSLIHETEEMKAERNLKSQEVPKLKKAGEDVSGLIREMRELADGIKERDERLQALDSEIREFMLGLPNLPAPSVVAGGKECNQVIKTFGEKPEFDFEPLHHVDIAEKLGLIDYARGVKLAGSGFWMYRGQGALLERALLNFFMDQHIKDGYEMILAPFILNYQCGLSAGQFPKFSEDVFQLRLQGKEEDEFGQEFNRFLLPTSETALVNLFRDEILSEEDLPIKLFSFSPCFRREAGSYRAEERGMIRGHQFNKVEMFQYTKPEDSQAALEELIGKACSLVEQLGLHYQLVKLAAGDVSASMRETWDVEVYIPSMGGYKEVSSVSNAGDYQARRGNLRYRDKKSGKAEFLHSLNGSGLATSRIFPAILEQNQTKDGRVRVPEVLRPYLNGLEYLA